MKKLQHTLAVTALVFGAAGAQAAIVPLTWTLVSASEVPPVVPPSEGFGTGGGSYNTETQQLTWGFNVEGLSSPAISAHFHGVGDVSSNAPALIDLTVAGGNGAVVDGIGATEGLYVGFIDFDDELVTEGGEPVLTGAEISGLLQDGWYVNIHTEDNPAGEVRGQIFAAVPAPVPVPAAAWLFGSALAGLCFVRRRDV